MPVFTVDKDWLGNACTTLESTLGLSPSWVKDMLTFTSTELGGGIAALAALLINLRSRDPDRYFQLCGSFSVSAAVPANPILAAMALAAMLMAAAGIPNPDAKAGWMNRLRSGAHRVRRRAGLILKGAAFSAVIIVVTTAVGGSAGLVTGLAVSIALPIAYRLAERRFAVKCAQVLVIEYERYRGAFCRGPPRGEAGCIRAAPDRVNTALRKIYAPRRQSESSSESGPC
jgi:hypothetical protein